MKYFVLKTVILTFFNIILSYNICQSQIDDCSYFSKIVPYLMDNNSDKSYINKEKLNLNQNIDWLKTDIVLYFKKFDLDVSLVDSLCILVKKQSRNEYWDTHNCHLKTKFVNSSYKKTAERINDRGFKNGKNNRTIMYSFSMPYSIEGYLFVFREAFPEYSRQSICLYVFTNSVVNICEYKYRIYCISP
jgi:hypothetical protein